MSDIYNNAIRKLVISQYMLHESAFVSVDYMSTSQRPDGGMEDEFKVNFINKTDWVDEGYVTKYVTVSVRDFY